MPYRGRVLPPPMRRNGMSDRITDAPAASAARQARWIRLAPIRRTRAASAGVPIGATAPSRITRARSRTSAWSSRICDCRAA